MFLRTYEDEGMPTKKKDTAKSNQETHEKFQIKLFPLNSNKCNQPKNVKWEPHYNKDRA